MNLKPDARACHNRRMRLRLAALSTLTIALVVPTLGCSRGDDPRADLALADALPRLTLSEVDALLEEARSGGRPVSVFDANERELYDSGHLPGAKWVPWNGLTAKDLPADKAQKLVFYCTNEQCTASHESAVTAKKLGHDNVYIMPAGIVGWRAENRPIEK